MEPALGSDGFQYESDDIRNGAFRLKLLGYRLRRTAGNMFQWDHLSTCYLEGKTVFIFVVVGGRAVTLEDDPLLYPSDTLISQLRLLIEAK